MKTSDFSFELPSDLIAQNPAVPRDAARLFVYDRGTNTTKHLIVKDLSFFLGNNDVLVFNRSKVIPARLHGHIVRKSVELLLVKQVASEDDRLIWQALVKPRKYFQKGAEFVIVPHFSARVLEFREQLCILSFPKTNFWPYVNKYGLVPLPPYIKNTQSQFSDYQTVFGDRPGSIAAPTAGLHFTHELLESLKARGVQIEYVTLHIGIGTFQPVRTELVTEHVMHAEYAEIPEEVAQRLNLAKKNGKRVIAVGTTAVRSLETSAVPNDKDVLILPISQETNLFIYPGYRWKFVDAIITNFHLPKSTLFMLICAFARTDLVKKIYAEAIRERYRFYSFGDALFIY